MRKQLYIYLYLALTLAYALFAVLSPSDPAALEKYNISQSGAHLLALTIVIPLSAIWLTALYGMVRVKNYAGHIATTKEGPGMIRVSQGLTAMAFSLPVSALVSALTSYVILKRSDMTAEMIIVRNYANLVLPAIGIILLAQGAQMLLALLKKNVLPRLSRLRLLAIIIFSSAYTWLIMSRPFAGGNDTIYYLPNALILLTLAIPYLYIWFQGMIAVEQLFIYKKHIRGSLYKKALENLARGIAAIVLISILTQLLVTLSGRLTRLNLTPILLIIYIFVALNSVGYVLIARGAKKLKQIEEV